MNSETEIYDLIDLYLRGALAHDHAFVKELEVNAQLRLEVEKQRLTNSAVIDFRILQMKQDLRIIQKQASNPAKGKLFLGIALGLIILLGGGYFWHSKPKTSAFEAESIVEKKVGQAYVLPTPEKELVPTEETSGKMMIREKETYAPTIAPLKESEPLKEIVAYEKLAKSDTQEIQNPPLTHALEHYPAEKDASPVAKNTPKNSANENPISEPKTDDLELSFVNYIFEPNRETLEIELKPLKTGQFTVMDKSGRMLLQKTFSNIDKFEWDGVSREGALLGSGIYPYIIEYTDGHIQKGSITIVL